MEVLSSVEVITMLISFSNAEIIYQVKGVCFLFYQVDFASSCECDLLKITLTECS